MTQLFTSADDIADAIIRDVGKTIVLGLPLGLGKANHIANALVMRATADPSIRLTIFTALTLEKPRPSSELERRFINPVIDRLFGGYPDLAYATALHANRLPENIEVNEFFFLAGRWTGSPLAQQNYISANYTHAFSYLLSRGVNVVTQLVAKREYGRQSRYSLSCNTDITVDLLKARATGGASFKLYGQVNSELPFMPGDGDLPETEFAGVLQGPEVEFPLFAPPAEPVSKSKYAIGIHVAGLIRDGGTLQIGIGQIGDALAQALIVRQRHNSRFGSVIQRLTRTPHAPETAVFDAGLYGVSEMFVQAFLELIKAGVIRREADGALLHAAFFLGPKRFYEALRDLPEADLARIQMTAVSYPNELYGDESGKRAARRHARFVNNTMMATLLGAAVSDGLEDGRVVSGVGGQYNFVAQAFALKDARSILTLEATRQVNGKPVSNIRWSYGHQTIPRHLRDIFVTEYGVADLRGKSDHDTIAAMLAVADSRFQDELMRQAKDAGKLAKSFALPVASRDNYPERIEAALGSCCDGLFPAFPFGSDFTDTERTLIPALQTLKEASASKLNLVRLAWDGLRGDVPSDSAALARMGLDKPKTLTDRAYRLLVRGAMARNATQAPTAP